MTKKQVIEFVAERMHFEAEEDGSFDLNSYDFIAGCSHRYLNGCGEWENIFVNGKFIVELICDALETVDEFEYEDED